MGSKRHEVQRAGWAKYGSASLAEVSLVGVPASAVADEWDGRIKGMHVDRAVLQPSSSNPAAYQTARARDDIARFRARSLISLATPGSDPELGEVPPEPLGLRHCRAAGAPG
jgi:hypothetical protein